MDVRDLDLLVSQTPASMLPGERYGGMPKRGLELMLASVLFWQLLWAQVDGFAVTGQAATLDLGSGRGIFNIGGPNGADFSHNQFRDYNLGTEGLILNNGIQRTQSTQRARSILGNPNRGGRAAKAIVSEANGGNPSQARGYTEVAARSDHGIIANPSGISCSSCDTARCALITEKPVLNVAGVLDYDQVEGGSMTIDGTGLNSDNVDRFDILTSSVKTKAEIQAIQLSIVAGRYDVDAQSLNPFARTADYNSNCKLPIYSHPLGGLYTRVINLVCTETRVGTTFRGQLKITKFEQDLVRDAELLIHAGYTGFKWLRR